MVDTCGRFCPSPDEELTLYGSRVGAILSAVFPILKTSKESLETVKLQ